MRPVAMAKAVVEAAMAAVRRVAMPVQQPPLVRPFRMLPPQPGAEAHPPRALHPRLAVPQRRVKSGLGAAAVKASARDGSPEGADSAT